MKLDTLALLHARVGRTLAAVVAAMFLAASCRGSSAAPPPETPTVGKLGLIARAYTGSGKKVVILGDSLTVLEWKDLYEGLDRHHAVQIGAFYGEGYNPGTFSDLYPRAAPLLVRTAAAYAATHPVVAVLALGTNDAWNARSTSHALAVMATMVAEFKGACLVGVTLPENSNVKGWSNVEARTLNGAMRHWASQIVDWQSMSLRPGFLRSDGIHTTAQGTATRAAAIIEAVQHCEKRAN